MLRLNIFTPERKILEGRMVLRATLPGSEGQVQILPGHAAMVGSLDTGVLTYQVDGEGEATAAVSTGFFSVKEDVLSLSVETLEMSGDIDLDRARAAQATAEKTLQEADLDEHRFKKYQLKLQRAILRQQVGAIRSQG